VKRETTRRWFDTTGKGVYEEYRVSVTSTWNNTMGPRKKKKRREESRVRKALNKGEHHREGRGSITGGRDQKWEIRAQISNNNSNNNNNYHCDTKLKSPHAPS